MEIPDTEQSQDLAFIKYRKYCARCTCMCVCLNMTQSNHGLFWDKGSFSHFTACITHFNSCVVADNVTVQLLIGHLGGGTERMEGENKQTQIIKWHSHFDICTHAAGEIALVMKGESATWRKGEKEIHSEMSHSQVGECFWSDSPLSNKSYWKVVIQSLVRYKKRNRKKHIKQAL